MVLVDLRDELSASAEVPLALTSEVYRDFKVLSLLTVSEPQKLDLLWVFETEKLAIFFDSILALLDAPENRVDLFLIAWLHPYLLD